MDTIDKRILEDLVQNCRITFQDMSRKYGISANAIRRRIRILEESGVITGYQIELASAMVGCETILGMIWTDGSHDEVELVDRLGASDNIIAAAAYSNGLFYFIGEYTDWNELLGVGSLVRTLPGSERVEIHPLVIDPGDRIDLTPIDLRVLSSLTDNPKKSVVDIAAETSLTARRVRKTLKRFTDSMAVRFAALVELGAAGSIPFIVRTAFDETAKSAHEVVDWIRDEYFVPLWQTFISASEPVVFALFSTETLTELDSITRAIRNAEFVDTVKVTVSTYHGYFRGLRSKTLAQLIQNAALE
ncbi:MAG: winged helix-turn-helix transcriptional regulator [Candidatus Thorarchaeota archaeon]|nr:MAG: winged helix-turn-helix transcriptional regulator [Candidatus Thorarchaeota archaeon]